MPRPREWMSSGSTPPARPAEAGARSREALPDLPGPRLKRFTVRALELAQMPRDDWREPPPSRRDSRERVERPGPDERLREADVRRENLLHALRLRSLPLEEWQRTDDLEPD